MYISIFMRYILIWVYRRLYVILHVCVCMYVCIYIHISRNSVCMRPTIYHLFQGISIPPHLAAQRCGSLSLQSLGQNRCRARLREAAI